MLISNLLFEIDIMLAKHLLNSISICITKNLFFTKEYICLPDFLIVGSDVIEESEDCTLFNIYKIYGWDRLYNNYSLCLFDAGFIPTVGVWQNGSLIVYQDVPTGYLRLSYLVKTISDPDHKLISNNIYQFYVDLSTNGVVWNRYTRGEYKSD